MRSASPLATCMDTKHTQQQQTSGFSETTSPNDQSPITPIQPDVPFLSELDRQASILVADASTHDPTHVVEAPQQHRLLRLYAVARAIRILIRPVTFLSAVFTLATMALVLSTFDQTVNVRRTLYLPPVPITRGPWHASTQTWPTYLLSATSVLTCVTSIIVAATYWYNAKFASYAGTKFSKLIYLLVGGHFVVWFGTAAAYHRGKDGTDLWGGSCTNQAQTVLQPFFQDQVDFRMLCAIQTSSWAISLVQVAMTAINFSLLWVLNRYLQQQQLVGEGQTKRRILLSHRSDSPHAFKAMLEYIKDIVGVAT